MPKSQTILKLIKCYIYDCISWNIFWTTLLSSRGRISLTERGNQPPTAKWLTKILTLDYCLLKRFDHGLRVCPTVCRTPQIWRSFSTSLWENRMTRLVGLVNKPAPWESISGIVCLTHTVTNNWRGLQISNEPIVFYDISCRFS